MLFRSAQSYKEAMTTIASIAKDRNLDLVLFSETFDPTAQPKDMLNRMATRRVLYARPALDITDELITRLDKQYKDRGGKSSLKIGL